VPIQDNWDSYIQDRKLLQPPSGISAPIPTTAFPAPQRLSMSPAVMDAIAQRRQRESLLTAGEYRGRIPSDSDSPGLESSQGDYLSSHPRHLRTKSAGNMPVSILPPIKDTPSTSQRPPAAQRTATYEELTERHRQKMREMQAPLTKSEREQADLQAAKERWDRSTALEREAVTKRQASEAAALLKDEKKRKSVDLDVVVHHRSRSLSIDRLAAMGGSSSKRMSTMKVEDWQKHQTEVEPIAPTKSSARSPREPEGSPVPFPNSGRPREPRRPRDPPR